MLYAIRFDREIEGFRMRGRHRNSAQRQQQNKQAQETPNSGVKSQKSAGHVYDLSLNCF
ncbi:MAG: hypothetical protein RIB49_02055 [Rhodospirillales bacterium]